MECTWPASKNLKEELVRGHQLAQQLRLVVGNGNGDDGGLLAKRFAKKILRSFTTSLSLLSGNHESKGEHIQGISTTYSTVALPAILDSSSWDALETIKSKEVFTDSTSSSRKRKISHSWSREAPDYIDDGHAWRKYGQKQILNARHPRCYFRCSHKYEQGCKATKQVQRIAGDPSLFRTTYFGNHTCKHSSLKSPELIIEKVSGGNPREESNSKCMITFESNNFTYEQQHPFSSSYKSTEREIIKSNHLSNSQPSSLPCDYLLKRDDTPMLFKSSEQVSRLPAMNEVQPEDMALMELFAQDIFDDYPKQF